MEILSATYRIITPVFCAGHHQNGPSEIRPFSLRGAARFWYRAVDPSFQTNEGVAFGSSAGSEGTSSPMVLLVTKRPSPSESKSYAGDFKPGKNQDGATYLGYSLYLRPNNRKGLPPGQEFTLEVSPRPGALPAAWDSPQTKEKKLKDLKLAQRAWAAGLWLLGHLGGLGSRSRRGIGTISLESWSGWPQCQELPPVGHPDEPRRWKDGVKRGLETIRGWFPGNWGQGKENPKHQTLQDLEKNLTIIQKRSDDHEKHSQDYRAQKAPKDWLQALRLAGSLYRDFRIEDKSRNSRIQGANASFGLPLDGFDKTNRAASRLHIRILELGTYFYPMFLALQGPLGVGEAFHRRAKLSKLVEHDPNLPNVFIQEMKTHRGGL